MLEPSSLTQAFLAACPAQAAASLAATVAKPLADLWRAASTAWPELTIDPKGFAQYLAKQIPFASEPLSELAQLHGADLLLAYACLQRLPAALTAFEQKVLVYVPSWINRLDSSPAFVTEVQQLMRTRLLVGGPEDPPRIAEYSGRGTLIGWARVVAVRTALNLRRGASGKQHQELDGLFEVASNNANPELAFIKESCRQEFKQAFADAFLALSPDERNVLRLHYLSELSCEKIGVLLRVHRNTVSRRLDSARSTLLYETRRLLQLRLRLPAQELDSLIEVARSQLSLSLSVLLRDV